MSEPRTIKKYPNRRLYDTEESRYITLADIRRLVLEDLPFTVIDQKSGDDITRSILLQVISEEESHGDPILTQDFLSEMIRAYSKSMPGFIGNYLEQSLRVFLRQQQQLRSQMSNMMGGVDPMAPVRDMAQQNWNQWVNMQQEMWQAMLGQPRAGRDTDTHDASRKDKK
ncbi:MAG: polyhydroxyalkanoate synthesis repressor PhaR [Gammaproteobacteria bacterium]|nr:polyhydroxyalkanoate synthesis repressor PhaR [Gammaproteobacteria bacterium]TVQ48431.1 MAG: polyhydroxyalkanoate synthesis repressor PhaR [Gammaproteobacteria bacterium]